MLYLHLSCEQKKNIYIHQIYIYQIYIHPFPLSGLLLYPFTLLPFYQLIKSEKKFTSKMTSLFTSQWNTSQLIYFHMYICRDNSLSYIVTMLFVNVRIDRGYRWRGTFGYIQQIYYLLRVTFVYISAQFGLISLGICSRITESFVTFLLIWRYL